MSVLILYTGNRSLPRKVFLRVARALVADGRLWPWQLTAAEHLMSKPKRGSR